MGWWSDLFKMKDVVVDSGLPKVQNPLPMPNVKPTKPEKDISEPVISFVECVRNDPKRFRIKTGRVLDRNTNTWFKSDYYLDRFEGGLKRVIYPAIKGTSNNTDWMTLDEIIYATEQLKNIQSEKVKTLKSKQRQKYMNIYKAEE